MYLILCCGWMNLFHGNRNGSHLLILFMYFAFVYCRFYFLFMFIFIFIVGYSIRRKENKQSETGVLEKRSQGDQTKEHSIRMTNYVAVSFFFFFPFVFPFCSGVCTIGAKNKKILPRNIFHRPFIQQNVQHARSHRDVKRRK